MDEQNKSTTTPEPEAAPEETPDFDLLEESLEDGGTSSDDASPTPVDQAPADDTFVESNGSPVVQEKGDEPVASFSLGKEIFEWVQAIVVAIVIAMAIRTFVFTLVNVDGESMEPTLHDSDRLIVTRLAYTPEKGDIIIFRPDCDPEHPYVKRVIAMPGDTIDINKENGDVLINGEIIEEPYIKEHIRSFGTVSFPAVVPEDHVFVMGDNRNHSKDSRFQEVGMVSYDSIIGKASFRFWPFSDWGSLYTDDAATTDEK